MILENVCVTSRCCVIILNHITWSVNKKPIPNNSRKITYYDINTCRAFHINILLWCMIKFKLGYHIKHYFIIEFFGIWYFHYTISFSYIHDVFLTEVLVKNKTDVLCQCPTNHAHIKINTYVCQRLDICIRNIKKN